MATAKKTTKTTTAKKAKTTTKPKTAKKTAAKTATTKAKSTAAKKAAPVLMEPVMSVEVTTPDEFTGAVTGDLNRRRGLMKCMEVKGRVQIVKADVPLAALFGYVTDLRTLTSGRAAASLTFSHYEKVPKNLAEEIIERVQGAVTMAK